MFMLSLVVIGLLLYNIHEKRQYLHAGRQLAGVVRAQDAVIEQYGALQRAEAARKNVANGQAHGLDSIRATQIPLVDSLLHVAQDSLISIKREFKVRSVILEELELDRRYLQP